MMQTSLWKHTTKNGRIRQGLAVDRIKTGYDSSFERERNSDLFDSSLPFLSEDVVGGTPSPVYKRKREGNKEDFKEVDCIEGTPSPKCKRSSFGAKKGVNRSLNFENFDKTPKILLSLTENVEKSVKIKLSSPLKRRNRVQFEDEEENHPQILQLAMENLISPVKGPSCLPTDTERIEQFTAVTQLPLKSRSPVRLKLFPQNQENSSFDSSLSDFNKKRKKPKKGGLLERAEKISARLISEWRVREYEAQFAEKKSDTKLFSIVDIWRRKMLLVIDDFGDRSIVCLDRCGETLKRGFKIRIYPPWQMLSVGDSNMTSIFMSIFKWEVVEATEQNACNSTEILKVADTLDLENNNHYLVSSLLSFI